LEITRKKMAHTTATQLYLGEKYSDYVFVHSQASQYEWLEKEYPALFKRVQEATKKGSWEPVGSMWVEADCNLTGGESLVRQFLYGRRYFEKKLGTVTDDMFLPDVFGYSAALPQILAKFGIRYFTTQKISWNQFNTFPHNTFWWQGIDGTKMWCHFPPANTYIGEGTPSQLLQSVKNHKDHARSDHSLYLFGWGDGGGGPTERHIELLRRAQMATNLPDVITGRKAAEFYKEARAKSKDLATWSGELYFEYHRGTYTTQANNKKHNRACEFLLRDAELLCCFREDFPKGYPKAELEAAWKLVLLNQFHDIIPGSSVREVYEDSDRDYEAVYQAGEKIVSESLRKIGSKFDSSSVKRPVAMFHNATMPMMSYIPWADTENVPQALETTDESIPVQLVDHYGEPHIAFTTPDAALGTVAVCDLSD
ncbi:MAG: alpha-mannosidase, partial [Fimbriimonadaceae bacterium]